MNLSQLYRKSLNKPLRVYWWRLEHPARLNFGDELTPLLIEKLFGRNVVWAEPKNCDLIGAGSIIEVVSELSNNRSIDVWGSGFIKPGDTTLPQSKLKFHAVRGRHTLNRVRGNKIVLGDPGLLTPLALPHIKPKKKEYRLGILPHYEDAKSQYLNAFKNVRSTVFIDPLWNCEKVAKTIASCEFVLSSSLHGLILSDAFGVPNQWIKLSDSLTGGAYKFEDYYSVFNEKPKAIQGDRLLHTDIDGLIDSYTSKSNLSSIQNDLLGAFPYQ